MKTTLVTIIFFCISLGFATDNNSPTSIKILCVTVAALCFAITAARLVISEAKDFDQE